MQLTLRRAVIAGATGLVGTYCLEELVGSAAYTSVLVLARRPIGPTHPKVALRIVEFGALDAEDPTVADDAFCCLGTTIREAGSRESFRKVDHDFVLGFARFARRSGVRRFVVISSLGADRRSRVFYSRVKGEVENALRHVGFESLIILRPSLLLGPRIPPRRGEQVAAALAAIGRPFMIGPFRRYRPVHARAVARAMVQLAAREWTGALVVESEEIPEA
ncbi:MAG TPA: NAD(P)H-binding protein [Gemmatimonadales bacterium]|nr:NAD(P)H-binding protein [Gemmatimonadales bacterium]